MSQPLAEYEHHVLDERATRLASPRPLPETLTSGFAWCGDPVSGWMFLGASHALDAIRGETYAQPCPACLRKMQSVLETVLTTGKPKSS